MQFQFCQTDPNTILSNTKKEGVSIRGILRFRTTYTKARKETPYAERSSVCFSVNQKVLISEYHKTQTPMATATGYVRRENVVLDFCCNDSFFDVKPLQGGGGYKTPKHTVTTVFSIVKRLLQFFPFPLQIPVVHAEKAPFPRHNHS